MRPGPGDDDFLEIELRSPKQIAGRILVLSAVVRRVMIEHRYMAAKDSDQDIDETLFDLRASLVLSGAEQELTASERALLGAPAGQMREDDLYDFGWEIEALRAILATVGLTEALPVPPSLGDIRAMEAVVAGLDPSVARIAEALRLPDDESAARSREIVELWLWRASVEREIRESGPREQRLLRAEVREVATEAQHAGLVSITADGDFETGSQVIDQWADEELAGFELASHARLRALNWLCGLGITWEDTPVEV